MPTSKPGRELIKQYLQDNGLKVSNLAKMYGLTKQEVSNYLNGVKENPAANKFILKVIRDLHL